MLVAAVCVVALGLAAGSLTSCAAEQEPLEFPAVSWEDGTPAGPLEADPWVQGVRAELEAEAVARNRLDFSIPEFAQTATQTYINRVASDAITDVSQHGATDLYPGPLPFVPVEVRVGYDGKDDDAAEVRGCVATDWTTESGKPADDLTARGIAYRLTRDSGGLVKVDSTLALHDLDCTALDPLPVALFTPAPEPSGITEVYDITRPSGTKVGGSS
ncbi:hypothetical protein AB0N73_05275 [Microbacterium sp. NPDC089189]|uniref:hypothetical protein n=1 Tax=Microbacterium sp. NPDC089189 TaxID=3154972 RepID=UPI00342A32DE